MIVGLVGGVGCGKSTVLKYLQKKYNAYIIEADQVAKDMMKDGSEVLNEIRKNFPEAFLEDDTLDRKTLADIIFNDSEKRRKINNITHPATINEIKNRINTNMDRLIILESAILIGTGLEDKCDEIWFVYCEKEERIKRLMDNRGYSREKTENIIHNQMSDDEINHVADEFIDNTLSPENTYEQIDFILNSQFC